MKKLIALVLSLALAASALVGCGLLQYLHGLLDHWVYLGIILPHVLT